MELLILLVGVILILVVTGIAIYNAIVAAGNAAKRAWSDVLTQERQKANVLPDLEALVRDGKEFEESILSSIVRLREGINGLDKNGTSEQLSEIESTTKEVITGIRATIENYPDLKTHGLINKLMQEISEQQENISAALRIFNQEVEIFNNKISSFPGNIVNAYFNRKVALNEFRDSEAENSFEYKPNF